MDRPGMKRVVSRFEVVALSVNDVIGSGIYLLPAQAAALLGGASVLAVLGAGVAVLLIVLCFADAGSRFDEPGSAYVYTRAAFGDFAGFEVGWMTWLARVASVAGLSAGFAAALGNWWSVARGGAGQVAAIAVPLVALVSINVLGVKHGARTAVTFTIAKLLPLICLIVIGMALVGPPRALALAFDTTDLRAEGLAEASLLLLFAYAGFENTAAAAGEFEDPRRDVPFALLTQIAIVTLVYTLVQLVVVAALPQPGASVAPLADAMTRLTGPAGGLLLTVGALVSILGTNSNTILAGPRYLYAIAATGALPKALTRLHPRFGTPATAIVAMGLVALPLALSGTFVELAALSVIARLCTYLGTAAAVLVLKRRAGERGVGFRLPLGPLVPLAAIGVCLTLIGAATWKNLLYGVLALAGGAVLWALGRRRRS